MIQSGTVVMARSALRISTQWLVCSGLLFVLQFLFPALKTQIESTIWASSLQYRSDGRLTALIVDGAVGWAGMICGLLVSSAMYRLALDHWRGVETSWKSLTAGAWHFQSFVALAFFSTALNEMAWYYIGAHLELPWNVFVHLVLTWIAITPFLFVVPLILEGNLPLQKAMAESLRAVRRQPMAAFLLLLGAGFWSFLGTIGCVVGAIYTQPIYQLAIARAYLDVFVPENATAPVPAGEPTPT